VIAGGRPAAAGTTGGGGVGIVRGSIAASAGAQEEDAGDAEKGERRAQQCSDIPIDHVLIPDDVVLKSLRRLGKLDVATSL
jgi:hypothetical protein